MHISLPAAARAPAPQHHTISLSTNHTQHYVGRNTLRRLPRRHRPQRESLQRPRIYIYTTLYKARDTDTRAQNNPLHISIFPSYDPTANAFTPVRNPLQFSLLLSSTIDVFDLRSKNSTASGDLVCCTPSTTASQRTASRPTRASGWSVSWTCAGDASRPEAALAPEAQVGRRSPLHLLLRLLRLQRRQRERP